MPQTVLHPEQGLQRARQPGLVHQQEAGLQHVHQQEHARQRGVALQRVHQQEPGLQRARQQEVEPPPVHLQGAVLQHVRQLEHVHQREVALQPVHQPEPGRQRARQQGVVPDIVAVVEVTTDLLPEVEAGIADLRVEEADTAVLRAVAGIAVDPGEAVDSAVVPEEEGVGDNYLVQFQTLFAGLFRFLLTVFTFTVM